MSTSAAAPLEFKPSEPCTLGVELELQLVDRRDGNLTRAASDLLEIARRSRPDLDIKLEITESMIEVATDVQRCHEGLLADLRVLRDTLCAAAERLDVMVCGGGTHPFQHWPEQRIADRPRFHHLAGLYGYLARQFTVFGQHVHIGCRSGDEAIRLLHGLSRYVPQFIALAASSPLQQGVDTAFDCSRMNTVASFPLSGRAPLVRDWAGFNGYFAAMRGLGVVETMKDFYWDIRPKPEYGTVEIRVFDTPLTVERAAALAIFAQAIARLLLDAPPEPPDERAGFVYGYNRFQACRFGLQGRIVDATTGEWRSVAEEVRRTLAAVRERVDVSAAEVGLAEIERCLQRGNHASWLRAELSRSSLEGMVFGAGAAFEDGRRRGRMPDS